MVDRDPSERADVAARSGVPVILHIEDNDGDAVIFQQALEEIGLDVAYHVVSSGALALRFLDRRDMYHDAPRPDLILLDLNMPVMNGFEFLRQLRSVERWRSLSVMVLTSSQRDQDRSEVMALGARDFQVKPDTFDGSLVLVHRMRELLLTR